MSQENIQTIIGRAVTDVEFRNALFADPDAALGGYDLTAEELANLRAIDFETIESFAGTLDDRISKASMFGMQSQLTQSQVASQAAGQVAADVAADAARVAAADASASAAQCHHAND